MIHSNIPRLNETIAALWLRQATVLVRQPESEAAKLVLWALQQEKVNSLTVLMQIISLEGVPQGSVLGPRLFLVYINDLTDNISSNIKLFADDSSLFPRADGINVTHNRLVQDLETIKKWAYQWKM